ncbi:MAG: hypothetical protein LBD94_01055, partial [Rickettsiales bacterium]|nr:hypothetical protein [Rickettsiales bacterium]
TSSSHSCSSAGACTTTSRPSTTTTNADYNRACWCRMTSPDLGESWVFLHDWGSASFCAYICAGYCAVCVQNGTSVSCSRAAVLSLP